MEYTWQDYLEMFLQKVKEAEGYNDTGMRLLEDSINGAFEALSESEDYYEEGK